MGSICYGIMGFCVCCLLGFDVVPDLETVNFKVLSRNDQYEIREVEV
jgi:hypothetical protein